MDTPPHDGTAEPGGRHAPTALAAPTAPGIAADASAEVRLRRALREAAHAVELSPWQPAAVTQRAARYRRTRRLAATLPLVAAVAACAVVMVAVDHDRVPGTPTLPAAPTGPPAGPSTSPPTAGRPTAAPTPALRIVQPGQPFAIGDGERMKLEPSRRCLEQDGGSWQCEDVAVDNRITGNVSSQNRADHGGTVYAPLYTGPVRPVRMTLTVQGHDYPVQLVALPGHPGYVSGYVLSPPPPSPGVFPPLTIHAYDSHGTAVATLSVPGSVPGSSEATQPSG